MNCPVCAKPCNTILVCPDCWVQVPRYDQIGFRRLYTPHPKKPKMWQSKADKIIRDLKAKLSTP